MQDKSDKKILVTGITGSQGNATARHLIKNGWTVFGLTRNPDSPKAKEIAALGVKLVKGDMASA